MEKVADELSQRAERAEKKLAALMAASGIALKPGGANLTGGGAEAAAVGAAVQQAVAEGVLLTRESIDKVRNVLGQPPLQRADLRASTPRPPTGGNFPPHPAGRRRQRSQGRGIRQAADAEKRRHRHPEGRFQVAGPAASQGEGLDACGRGKNRGSVETNGTSDEADRTGAFHCCKNQATEEVSGCEWESDFQRLFPSEAMKSGSYIFIFIITNMVVVET